MLELSRWRTAIAGFAVGPLDLTVAPCRCHALLGPSGSGKSTLLASILGQLPGTGTLRLDGVELNALPIERRGIGYVPQRLALFPHLRVGEQLWYGARARGLDPARARPLIERLVQACGIGALLERRPHQLSGGEAQRVALVRALAAAPRLLLLDEPFSALPAALSRELAMLVRSLLAEMAIPALVVTHALHEAFWLAGEASVLIGGRVAQQGPLPSLYQAPASAEVARLLGVENLLPGAVRGRDGDRLIVALGHWRLGLPDPGGLPERVLVALRAEALRLSPPSEAPLTAVVTALLPAGSAWELALDAGVPLVARVPLADCPRPPAAGSTVGIRLAMDALRLYPLA